MFLKLFSLLDSAHYSIVMIDLRVDYDWDDTVFAYFVRTARLCRAPERGLDIRIKAPPARASADKPSASDTIPDMNSLAAVSELRIQ